MRSASDVPDATRREVGRGQDLTSALTVFVTTVGAPTFESCLAHLQAQDVRTRFELVDRVAPLPAALQLMLERCTTPYFVQVDEDMLLDPDAVRRLYELMQAEWPTVAVLVGQLYDPHLDRSIEGVKLHRLDYSSQFPWPDYASVIVRNQALAAGGYRVARRPLAESGSKMTFGIHEIGRDPRRVFERYRDLERLRRAMPDEVAWFADYPAEFLRRFLDARDAVDFFALMGVLAAGRRGEADAHSPKDFRRPPDEAFHAALELWSALAPSPLSDG